MLCLGVLAMSDYRQAAVTCSADSASTGEVGRRSGQTVMEGRKQAVSLRLSSADLRNVRKLAKRLGVRTSDVIRYALKSCIARLEPLLESEVTGAR